MFDASNAKLETFMDYVQLHERTWGTEAYANRPTLSDFMAAPIVVFWTTEDAANPYKATLHDDIDDIEKLLLRMLLSQKYEPPKEKLHRIFRNQKRLAISGVSLEFREAE